MLIPEGLVEFIPEMKTLIAELNDKMALKQNEFNALKNFSQKKEWLKANLSKQSFAAFDALPEPIADQF